MSLLAIGAAALAIAVGAALQKIAGMGLALIAGPVLSLVLGPVDGIIVVNALAVVNALTNTFSSVRDIEWRTFGLIAPMLVVGSIPGAFVVREGSPGLLQLTVGILLLIALAVAVWGKRFVPPLSGKAPAVVAGGIGGFMNTLAGVAGPAITVYAEARRWDHRAYAATLQPLFAVGGASSIVVKTATGAADWSGTEAPLWIACLVAVFVGILVGRLLRGRVPQPIAHRIALALAGVGGVAAAARGVAALAAGE
ncbi:sulfite exporter TauE/SafE family protein [Corynebacterium otitidis]|uniref:sulfite exporter TauE/SafE family protein n=1 Tax=Corynebacterium otitidis TaxID=29321 RepID=UPI0006276CE6|nr:sulfite exporter TauE/SafE family protein [Corynebacterium otitidis]KKO82919.1 permease [Corynebacterium otitidis]